MSSSVAHTPYGSRIGAATLVMLHLVAGTLPLSAATQAFRWSSLSDPNPTPVEGPNLSSVATGTDWSFALQSDGRVISAQPGRAEFYEPPSSLTNAVSIAARYYIGSALRSNGRVVNWGGLVVSPPATLSNVVAIAQGAWQTIALRSDGTVAAWGNPEYPAGIDIPLNLADVVAVSSGELNSLALRADGTVASWAVVVPDLASIPEAATNVIAIAAGYRENFVLRADGTVVGWSDGGSAFFPTFDSTNLVDIAAGPNVLLALTGDGRVLRSGIGDIGVTNVLEITPADYHERFMVLTGDGSPHIVHQPPDSSGTTGQKLRLVAKVGGQRPLALQWTRDGAPIPDATNTVLLLDHASLADSGAYQLIATNALGTAQSRTAILTLLDAAPRVYRVAIEPQTRVAFSGGSASLAVEAAGSTPIHFQWQFEGQDIPGATNASVSLANLSLDQSGNYSVVVSNRFGSVTVPAGRLTVSAVAAWGSNWDKAIQVPEAATNVVAISGGMHHSVAVRADGTVVVWGNSPTGGGQYAGGLLQPPSDLTDVVAVAAGDGFNVALLSNGRLRSWGQSAGFTGRLSGLSNIIAVAADYSHTLALGADGTVYSAGQNFADQRNVPPGLNDAVAIAAAWEASTVLRSNGSLVEWGSGRRIGADASIHDFVAIAPGLGLRADGSLFGGWFNGFQPAEIVSLAASRDHSLALRRNGTVVASGNDYHGQVSVPSDLRNVVAIAAGFQHSLALVGGGPPRIVQQPLGFSPYTGGNARLRVSAVGELPLSYQWRQYGIELAGATDSLLALDGVSFFDGGDYDVVVSNARGSVTSSVARLTLTSRAPFDVRLQIQPTNQVAFLGETALLSVEAQGTPPFGYRWQVNDHPIPNARDSLLKIGPLEFQDSGLYTAAAANPFGTSTSPPVRLSVVNVAAWGGRDAGSDNRVFNIPPDMTDAVAVAPSAGHVLARRANGTTVAWGNPASAKLNVPASATNLISIAAGGTFSLGLRSDRTVLAWGDANPDAFHIRNLPQSLSNVVQIAAGYSWALALRGDGTVVQWGFNGTAMRPPPEGLSQVVQITAADHYALALLGNGTVVGWGSDTNLTTPPPNLGHVVALGAGNTFALALRDNGSVVQWGVGVPAVMPIPPEASRLVAIATGAYHSLGLRDDGTVVSWGYGIGAYTRVPSNLPPVVAIAAAGDASFAVIPTTKAPYIARQPRHQERFSGQSLFLESSLFPTTLPTTFQWLRNGAEIPGETNLTFLRGSATPADSGHYQLVARNSDGTAFSHEAIIQIVDQPPRILTEPLDVRTYQGGPAEFRVVAEGSPELRYQWLFNGAPIPGATNALFTLTTVVPENAGSYQLALENPFGTQLTRTAQLQLTAATYLGDTQIPVDAFGRYTVQVRLSEPAPTTVDVTLTCGNGQRISATIAPGEVERRVTLADLDLAARLRAGETEAIHLDSTSFGIVGSPGIAHLVYAPAGFEPPLLRVLVPQPLEFYRENEIAFLNVTLEGPARIAGQEVLFHTRNRSAKAGEDYQFTSGILRFEAGQTEANNQISIPLLPSTTLKPDTTFEVVFRDASGGTGETLGVATVRLVGTIRLQAGGLTEENGASIDLVSAPQTFPLRVRTVDGTAKAGLDYVAVDRELSGPDDAHIDMEFIDDGLVEGPETFELLVSRPGETQPIATFTFAIQDNEIPLGQDESFQPQIHPLVLNQSTGIMKSDGSLLFYSGFDQAFHHLAPDGAFLRRLPTATPKEFQPLGMVQQPDGKFLLGFDRNRPDFNPDQPALTRWTEDGKPDPSFRFNLAVQRVTPVAVQRSGRILILAETDSDASDNSRTPSRLLRLNPDGSLDPSFRSDGRGGLPLIPKLRITPPTEEIGLYLPGRPRSFGFAIGSLVTLDSDGQFLREQPVTQDDFTTHVELPDGTQYGEYIRHGLPGNNSDRLVRRRPDGSDDPAFLSSRFDLFSPWRLLGVQPDGKPVVMSAAPFLPQPKLIRFLVNTPKDRRRIEWSREYTTGTSGNPREHAVIGREGGPIFLPLQRLGDTTRDEQVTLSTRDGLAVHDRDFPQTNILVALPAGVAELIIRIETTPDRVSEGFEDFDVLLSDPSPGLEMGDSRLRVGLYDTTPVLRFFTLPPPFGNNELRLNAEGFRGRKLVLEGSTDLTHWQAITEWTDEFWGPAVYVPVDPAQPYRFLRAVGR